MEITYFNARSKAKEAKLLKMDGYEKLIKSSTLDELIKNLLDLKLIKGENISGFADLKQITKRKEKEFVEFLKHEQINENLTKFFLLPYDYFNLESLYFNVVLKKFDSPLKIEGSIKIQRMEKCLEKDELDGLTPFMQNLIVFLKQNTNQSSFFVDNAFKQTMQKEMLSLAKVSKPLLECLNYLTDLKNIELALRLRDEQMFNLTKLEGGSLKGDFFKLLLSKSFASILAETKFSPYKNVVEIIVEAMKQKMPFQKYDFLVDCFPITFFEDKKYDTSGMMPYIRYCYLEKNEIKNLDIIFDGLSTNQPKKKILSSLRRVYEK